jgi:hypothetical protein
MIDTLSMQPATPETIWAILQETAKSQKETERIVQETVKSQKETEQIMKETERIVQETAKSQKETERIAKENEKRMKELQKTVGGMANNQGSFAEEYFFNSFENGQKNFFGEKFDDVKKQLKNFWQGIEDEYDIVLYNHTSVALIEVKYKAHVKDIPVVLKKAETFRILFPNYKDFKIYLGLASMSFYPELEQECISEGIAIIKQVGDTVVINDEHLKTF